MKVMLILPTVFALLFSYNAAQVDNMIAISGNKNDSIPYILGNFTDDYGIHYSISDTLWTQLPIIRYHILKWNKEEQYFIAKNDEKNPTEGGLFTRIDYMQFNDMKPWLWGFCYTVYNAKTDSAAENAMAAARNNPRKGCNGFPFSRMMKTE